MTAVAVDRLCVSYGTKRILTDFSLDMAQGEALLIRGISGVGKSTLLHAVCGLIPGSISAEISGDIRIHGRDIHALSKAERAGEIGIVFQNAQTQLFCDTIEDEIAFGLENILVPREEMEARIANALALAGLERYRYVSPKDLSGGQMQLVVLCAVLALEPRILLLDEALSQLDGTGRALMLEKLSALRESGTTLLMVDHDDTLLPLATREIVLE